MEAHTRNPNIREAEVRGLLGGPGSSELQSKTSGKKDRKDRMPGETRKDDDSEYSHL